MFCRQVLQTAITIVESQDKTLAKDRRQYYFLNGIKHQREELGVLLQVTPDVKRKQQRKVIKTEQRRERERTCEREGVSERSHRDLKCSYKHTKCNSARLELFMTYPWFVT